MIVLEQGLNRSSADHSLNEDRGLSTFRRVKPSGVVICCSVVAGVWRAHRCWTKLLRRKNRDGGLEAVEPSDRGDSMLPSRSSKIPLVVLPESPSDLVNTSARPRRTWMIPRVCVPIQRPPSRSRSSSFESTSRSDISASGFLAPRIGYASKLSPTSCLSPARLMPTNTRPSSALLRSPGRIPGVAYRLGGPGFHRQIPVSAQTHRASELSSPTLQTKSRRRHSPGGTVPGRCGFRTARP